MWAPCQRPRIRSATFPDRPRPSGLVATLPSGSLGASPIQRPGDSSEVSQGETVMTHRSHRSLALALLLVLGPASVLAADCATPTARGGVQGTSPAASRSAASGGDSLAGTPRQARRISVAYPSN